MKKSSNFRKFLKFVSDSLHSTSNSVRIELILRLSGFPKSRLRHFLRKIQIISQNWVLWDKFHASHICSKTSFFQIISRVCLNFALHCVVWVVKSGILTILKSEKFRHFETHKWKFEILTMEFILAEYVKICAWWRNFLQDQREKHLRFLKEWEGFSWITL